MRDLVYVHAGARKPEGENFAYYATAIFDDERGRNCACSVIEKLPASHNAHFRAIQCYANALDLIHKKQSGLIDNGIKQVLIVIADASLKKWIKTNKIPSNYKEAFEKLHTLYGFGGAREIKINVGLANNTVKNQIYKYCTEEYLGKAQRKEEFVSVLDMLDGTDE